MPCAPRGQYSGVYSLAHQLNIQIELITVHNKISLHLHRLKQLRPHRFNKIRTLLFPGKLISDVVNNLQGYSQLLTFNKIGVCLSVLGSARIFHTRVAGASESVAQRKCLSVAITRTVRVTANIGDDSFVCFLPTDL